MDKNIFPKTIADKFNYSFSIQEFGLYAITLIASCRSAKQTGKKGGEDLRVEIEGRKFREVPTQAKPQYQDFPPWATEDNFKVKIGAIYFYELEA